MLAEPGATALCHHEPRAKRHSRAIPDWAASRNLDSKTRRRRASRFAARGCDRARQHRHHPAATPVEYVGAEISRLGRVTQPGFKNKTPPRFSFRGTWV